MQKLERMDCFGYNAKLHENLFYILVGVSIFLKPNLFLL